MLITVQFKSFLTVCISKDACDIESSIGTAAIIYCVMPGFPELLRERLCSQFSSLFCENTNMVCAIEFSLKAFPRHQGRWADK